MHDVDTIVSLPWSLLKRENLTKGDGVKGEKEPVKETTVDQACWIYDQRKVFNAKRNVAGSQKIVGVIQLP